MEISKTKTLLHWLHRRLYGATLGVYLFTKARLKPFVRRHPRLRHAAFLLKEAVKTLIQPAPGNSATPVQTNAHGEPNCFRPDIPDWLVKEWHEIHAIEPRIYPSRELLTYIGFYDIPETRIAKPFLELTRAVGDNVSHLFLVPWLERGGADLVTLNYIREIDGKFTDRIAVIATLPANSVWKDRLPDGVRFIPFGNDYAHLSHEERELLLLRLLLQKAPAVLHVINSELGYILAIKYGHALTRFSRLYFCAFCGDRSAEGAVVGYSFGHLSDCFEHVTAVLTDNYSHVDELHQIYALDRKKFIVHYQPAPGVPSIKHFTPEVLEKPTLDVLWAHRLDRQKRPDILIQVAKACRVLPIHFHVYGSPVIDIEDYIGRFRELDNLTYHGAFDGLPSLSAERFDLFLNTSQWEGLPNILLEAISMGLPVLSSDVGGIRELIKHEETGLLISPYDDVDGYLSCLKSILADRTILPRLAENAIHLVKTRHSRESFRKTLEEIPGYCLPYEN